MAFHGVTLLVAVPDKDAKEHSGDVRVQNRCPVRFVHLEGRYSFRDAGGGDDDVDLVECGERGIAQCAQRGRVADVGRNTQRAASAGFNQVGNLLDRRQTAAGRHHVGAGIGQAEGNRAPDPGCAANDYGGAVRQIERDRHQRAGLRRARGACAATASVTSRAWYDCDRSR